MRPWTSRDAGWWPGVLPMTTGRQVGPFVFRRAGAGLGPLAKLFGKTAVALLGFGGSQLHRKVVETILVALSMALHEPYDLLCRCHGLNSKRVAGFRKPITIIWELSEQIYMYPARIGSRGPYDPERATGITLRPDSCSQAHSSQDRPTPPD
ncbi:hypothetical protein SAMN03159288_05311 [Rhizobium sp. NFACC06-2]|jgi:hypothetical protein|nr:hypothetical protein SAMN03159288_05311 [Rhizobium sp. NFACC06-2]